MKTEKKKKNPIRNFGKDKVQNILLFDLNSI